MDYSEYKQIAHEKLSEYGNPIKLIHVNGEAVYNPDTNEYDNDETITIGVGLQSEFNQKYIDGTNIKMEDKKFVVEIDNKPLSGDMLEYCGKQYQVINTKEVNPNGEMAIIYIIQAR